jgi:hypothetical protein
MTTVTSTKRAAKLMKDAGSRFIAGFSATNPSIIQLRSKDPGICWKAGGTVAFATITEFSGPTATEDGAPHLLRLQTNAYPPPAVFYHLRSAAVRNKLGVGDVPLLCKEPVLELTALPEEIGKFGRWLTTWCDAQFYRLNLPPAPPVELISWGWNDDGSGRKDDLMQTGANWRNSLYLWTPTALRRWEDWLAK